MDMRSVIDGFLELTVVGSFSRVGHEARRRLFGWEAPPDGVLHGRTALVTGPTSGLGRAAAGELGRSPERLGRVRDELLARHGEDRFPIVVADMASLASVRAAVSSVLADEARLDIVVDNAGTIESARSVTEDGIERTFATMVVGPFALVTGLQPLLERTGGARVIAVTSGGQYTQALALDDLSSERGTFNGPRAYARAKRAQVGLVREWARRLAAEGSDLVVMAMHPGWADTPGLAGTLPGFYGAMRPLLRTPEQGAETVVWLASAPRADIEAGRLYLDRRPRPFDRAPWTVTSAEERRRLWETVAALASGPGNPSARGLRATG
jgi:dehydrogenase/reductase SDR family protein 12